MANTLVVDDERAVRQIVCDAVQHLGHSAYPAADGEAALAIAKVVEPQLVLLDVRLPGISGFATANQLLKVATPPRVIFMTQFPIPMEWIHLFSDPSVGYIDKPFGFGALATVIGQALLPSARARTVALADAESVTPTTVDAAVAHILKLLLTNLPAPAFFSCAKQIGRLVRASGQARTLRVRAALDAVRVAQFPRRFSDDRVVSAIAMLERAGARCGCLREHDIASMLHLDPAHLGHLIRRQTGLSFREWSWAIRLQLAAARLADPSVLVKEVAHESGFIGSTQFGRTFCHVFGVTPSHFRRLVVPTSQSAST